MEALTDAQKETCTPSGYPSSQWRKLATFLSRQGGTWHQMEIITFALGGLQYQLFCPNTEHWCEFKLPTDGQRTSVVSITVRSGTGSQSHVMICGPISFFPNPYFVSLLIFHNSSCEVHALGADARMRMRIRGRTLNPIPDNTMIYSPTKFLF